MEPNNNWYKSVYIYLQRWREKVNIKVSFTKENSHLSRSYVWPFALSSEMFILDNKAYTLKGISFSSDNVVIVNNRLFNIYEYIFIMHVHNIIHNNSGCAYKYTEHE